MSKLRKKSVNALHRLFADTVLKWQDPTLSETLRRYALEHGAYYLYAVADHEGLWNLLRDETFRRIQVETTGQYEATYRALQRGLDAQAARDGKDPEDDGRLCWMALRAAELGAEAQQGITTAFEWMRDRPLEDGQRVEDALGRISVLDDNGFYRAVLLLLWIEADRMEALPEHERTDRWARQVVDAVEERIPAGSAKIDWSRFLPVDFMTWLTVKVQAACRHLDLAPVTAHTSNASDYVTRLLEPCPQATKVDEPLIQHGIQVIERITEDHHRAETLAAVAAALARSGNQLRAAQIFDEAVDVADAVTTGRWKAKAFARIGTLIAKSGDAPRALAVCAQAWTAAQSIPDDRWKAEAMAFVVSAFAAAEQLQRAIQVAQTITEEYRRARAIGAVVSVVAESGDAERVHSTCEPVLRTADGFTNARWKAETLASVASAFAAIGNSSRANRLCKQALVIAEALSNDYWASEIIAAVCAALARTTQSPHSRRLFEHARRLAGGMTDELFQASTFAAIASALEKAGQFDQALSVAQAIPDGRWKAKTLTALANARDSAQAGPIFDQAIQVAREITDVRWQAETLAAIAADIARAGHIDRALQLVDTIAEGPSKAGALATTLTRIASAGDVLRARQIFERSILAALATEPSSTTDNTETLVAVAAAFAQTERFEHALRAAQKITHDGWKPKTRKATALATLAAALAKAGNGQQANEVFEQALAVTTTIETDYWKASTLAAIAAAAHSTGDTERTRRILEKALEVAKMIGDHHSKADCLVTVSSAFARTGHFEKALRAADAIEDDHRNAEAKAAVSSALAGAGKIEQAIQAADRNTDDRFKAKSLAAVASALAKADDTAAARRHCDQALQAANSASYAADALSAIASVFARIGQVEKALEVAGRLTKDSHICDALVGIILALNATAGARRVQSHIDQVIQIADSVESPLSRAGTLAALGSAFAEVGDPARAHELVERAIQVSQRIAIDRDKAKSLVAIGRALAKMGNAGRFERLLNQLSASQQVWDDLLPLWRDVIRTGGSDPCALLRKSMCHAPFSTTAALNGIHTLLLAHIQARDDQAWTQIIRHCPQLDLDFLLDNSPTITPP